MIAFVHSEPYSPQKQRRVVVCVRISEVHFNWTIASRCEAYYMSCQGSTLCPQLLAQITPKRSGFIWSLMTIISPNLPQYTL